MGAVLLRHRRRLLPQLLLGYQAAEGSRSNGCGLATKRGNGSGNRAAGNATAADYPTAHQQHPPSTHPCITVVAPAAASCLRMPYPMPVLLPAAGQRTAAAAAAVGGGSGGGQDRREARQLLRQPHASCDIRPTHSNTPDGPETRPAGGDESLRPAGRLHRPAHP